MKFIFEFEGNSTLPPQTQQDLCENNKRFLQAEIPLNKIGLIFAKFARHNELADINVVLTSFTFRSVVYTCRGVSLNLHGYCLLLCYSYVRTYTPVSQ